MQFRGLLIGLAVLALLGGGLYWSNKTEDAKKTAEPKDASPKILTLQESEIAQLEFRKKDTPATVVKRVADGKWTITEPKPLAADADSIAAVTGVLANFSSETVSATPPADLAGFGLKDPLLTVNIVKKDGKRLAVLVGDNVPVTGSVFVKLADDPRVFTAAAFNRMSLDKSWRELRDKRLLTIENDKLSRVELSSSGKTVEFGKNQSNEWQIVKPNPYRADTVGVEELVRKLKDAKLDPASPDADIEKAGVAFASAAPVAIAKLTDATGTQQLEVRKTKDATYYAKSTAVEGVYKVQPDMAVTMSKSVVDFRNKKLFDFGFNDPLKLEIKVAGKAKSCGKNGEKWICEGKEVKPETVTGFIDKIRDLSAKQFVDGGAKLATPEIEVTVITSDAKKTETVKIAGDKAARGDEPAMYELEPGKVEAIKQAFDAIQEPPAPPPPPADAKKK